MNLRYKKLETSAQFNYMIHISKELRHTGNPVEFPIKLTQNFKYVRNHNYYLSIIIRLTYDKLCCNVRGRFNHLIYYIDRYVFKIFYR